MALSAVKRGQKVQIEVDTGIKKNIIDCYIIEPESDRLTISFPPSKNEYTPYLSEGTEIKLGTEGKALRLEAFKITVV